MLPYLSWTLYHPASYCVTLRLCPSQARIPALPLVAACWCAAAVPTLNPSLAPHSFSCTTLVTSDRNTVASFQDLWKWLFWLHWIIIIYFVNFIWNTKQWMYILIILYLLFTTPGSWIWFSNVINKEEKSSK